MNKYMQFAKTQWKDIVTLVTALVLFFSPWLFGYADSQVAMWNAVIIGAIMAVAALAVLVKFHDWEEWGMLAMGIWLIIAPILFGYAALPVAAWTQMLTGIVAIGMTSWSIWDMHHQPTTQH